MTRRILVFTCAVAVLVFTAGSAGAEVANQVLAVVGEDVITMLDLEKLIGPTVAKIRAQGNSTAADSQIATLRSQALNQMIMERLTSAEANRLGIRVRKSDVDDGVKRVLDINNLTREELIRRLAKDGVTLEAYPLGC